MQGLCGAAGGVRPQPTPEQLRSFVQQASTLDPESIALELSQQLVAQAWQSRVRALAAIQATAEAVTASGGDHALALTVASLASVPETFDGVLTHSNPAVRQAARSCAAALGFPAHGGPEAAAAAEPARAAAPAADLLGGAVEASKAQQPAAAPSARGAPDLLDLMDGPANAGPAGGAESAATARGNAADDLLGGLSDWEAAAHAPMSGAGAPAAAQPSNQPSAVTDMFAGLSMASTANAGHGASIANAQEDDPFAGLDCSGPSRMSAQASNGEVAAFARAAPSTQTALGQAAHDAEIGNFSAMQPQMAAMPMATGASLQAMAHQSMQMPQAHHAGSQWQGHNGAAWHAQGTQSGAKAIPSGVLDGSAGPMMPQVHASQSLAQQGLPASSAADAAATGAARGSSGRTLPAKPSKRKDAFDFVNDMVGGA